MKNLITATTLALVLTFGVTFANAGIIISDRTDSLSETESTCTSTESDGIIISDVVGTFSSLVGILILDLTGSDNCPDSNTTASDGIIISDRSDGIIISDRADGIIISD